MDKELTSTANISPKLFDNEYFKRFIHMMIVWLVIVNTFSFRLKTTHFMIITMNNEMVS